MPRINLRPDIIYVKDLSENEKDRFENFMKIFKLSNNSDGIKQLITEFFIIKDKLDMKEKEVKDLKKLLENALYQKENFNKNISNLIDAISSVESTITLTKKDLKKLL